MEQEQGRIEVGQDARERILGALGVEGSNGGTGQDPVLRRPRLADDGTELVSKARVRQVLETLLDTAALSLKCSEAYPAGEEARLTDQQLLDRASRLFDQIEWSELPARAGRLHQTLEDSIYAFAVALRADSSEPDARLNEAEAIVRRYRCMLESLEPADLPSQRALYAARYCIEEARKLEAAIAAGDEPEDADEEQDETEGEVSVEAAASEPEEENDDTLENHIGKIGDENIWLDVYAKDTDRNQRIGIILDNAGQELNLSVPEAEWIHETLGGVLKRRAWEQSRVADCAAQAEASDDGDGGVDWQVERGEVCADIDEGHDFASIYFDGNMLNMWPQNLDDLIAVATEARDRLRSSSLEAADDQDADAEPELDDEARERAAAVETIARGRRALSDLKMHGSAFYGRYFSVRDIRKEALRALNELEQSLGGGDAVLYEAGDEGAEMARLLRMHDGELRFAVAIDGTLIEITPDRLWNLFMMVNGGMLLYNDLKPENARSLARRAWDILDDIDDLPNARASLRVTQAREAVEALEEELIPGRSGSEPKSAEQLESGEPSALERVRRFRDEVGAFEVDRDLRSAEAVKTSCAAIEALLELQHVLEADGEDAR